MSGVSLTYTLDDHPLLRRLSAYEQLDMEPVFDSIGRYLVDETEWRFKNSVGPEGEPWKPSQRVLAHRQSKKYRKEPIDERPLIHHSILMTSITYRASHDKVEQGSGEKYAAIHQFGGYAGKNLAAHIDARPFIGVNDADRDEIGAICADYLKRLAE